MYNNILPASKLQPNHMYHFFKVGGRRVFSGVGGNSALLGRRSEHQRWLLGRERVVWVRRVAFWHSSRGAPVRGEVDDSGTRKKEW